MAKKSRLKNGYYTFLIIPEHEASTKTIKVRTYWFFLSAAVLICLVALISFFIYENINFLKKANQYDQLLIENQQLTSDNLRIEKLFAELQKLQSFRKRTLKSLASTSQFDAINSDISLPDTVIQFLKNTSSDEEKYLKSIESLYESIPVKSPISNPIVSRAFEENLADKTGHLGIDLVTSPASAVLASASGVVVFSDWTNKYGYTIIIRHPHHYITIYKHNQNSMVLMGQEVKQGDVIARVGNTGDYSTGVHCHFEIWKNGRAINPALMIEAFR